MFKEELGEIKGIKAKISIDPQAQPRFCKPRPVPFSLRNKIEKELERLEKEGIIEAIEHADWAAPIVPVVKRRRIDMHMWRLPPHRESSLQIGCISPTQSG